MKLADNLIELKVNSIPKVFFECNKATLAVLKILKDAEGKYLLDFKQDSSVEFLGLIVCVTDTYRCQIRYVFANGTEVVTKANFEVAL